MIPAMSICDDCGAHNFPSNSRHLKDGINCYWCHNCPAHWDVRNLLACPECGTMNYPYDRIDAYEEPVSYGIEYFACKECEFEYDEEYAYH